MHKSENFTQSLMAQQIDEKYSVDVFPDQPWATRALIELLIEQGFSVNEMTALDPACGRGHMAQTMRECFAYVEAADTRDYGFGKVSDFLKNTYRTDAFDWVITSPPIELVHEFAFHALRVARRGVALMVPTALVENSFHWQQIVSARRPTKIAKFVKHIPDRECGNPRNVSPVKGYTWIVWECEGNLRPQAETLIREILASECRDMLEYPGDDEEGFLEQGSFKTLQPELFW